MKKLIVLCVVMFLSLSLFAGEAVSVGDDASVVCRVNAALEKMDVPALKELLFFSREEERNESTREAKQVARQRVQDVYAQQAAHLKKKKQVVEEFDGVLRMLNGMTNKVIPVVPLQQEKEPVQESAGSINACQEALGQLVGDIIRSHKNVEASLKMYIDAGGDINAYYRYQHEESKREVLFTPLHLAFILNRRVKPATRRDINRVRDALLAAGADPNIRSYFPDQSRFDEGPLHEAVREDIEKTERNPGLLRQKPPLFWSVTLVKHGACADKEISVDTKTSEELNPFELAVQGEQPCLVRMLVQAGGVTDVAAARTCIRAKCNEMRDAIERMACLKRLVDACK